MATMLVLIIAGWMALSVLTAVFIGQIIKAGKGD